MTKLKPGGGRKGCNDVKMKECRDTCAKRRKQQVQRHCSAKHMMCTRGQTKARVETS